MSLFNVFNLSGSATHAQNVRLTTVAQNLANVNTSASDPDDVYRERTPVFKSVLDGQMDSQGVAVKVVGIHEAKAEPLRVHNQDHPHADEDGYIYQPNINPVEQMTNMMTASRSFQVNIEMMNTAKDLLIRTIRLGQ
ncbi:MAG: flagellar basal body rod protein FlgC [Pseudomonadota bacterium]